MQVLLRQPESLVLRMQFAANEAGPGCEALDNDEAAFHTSARQFFCAAFTLPFLISDSYPLPNRSASKA